MPVTVLTISATRVQTPMPADWDVAAVPAAVAAAGVAPTVTAPGTVVTDAPAAAVAAAGAAPAVATVRNATTVAPDATATATGRVPAVAGEGAEEFTDGRDITSSNVGLAGRGLTEDDLTSRAGGTLTSGTYTRQLFTSPVVITGAVTLTECKIKTSSGDTANAALRFDGDGTGRAIVEWCDITSSTITGTPPDAQPNADRAIGVTGNQPFTLRYCNIHDTVRGMYVASHGISASYPRIVEWNMFGNMYTNVPGDHTSNVGTGNGAHAWWMEVRGNRFLNNCPEGDASGNFQLYPENTFDEEYGYWLIEKNYLEATTGGYNITFGWGPTETRPHDMTFRDNWFGTDGQFGYVANAGSPSVMPGGASSLTPNEWNNIWYNNRLASNSSQVYA